MALETNELLTSVDRLSYPRIQPYTGGVRSKKLAGIVSAAGTVLPVGTPMCYDTATANFKPYALGAANGGDAIRAFVYPNEITLADVTGAEEVLGNLMFRGEIHAADVALPTGQLQASLDAALLDPTIRDHGLDIQALPDVH